MNYRGSYKRLRDNSKAAMLAAIEVYNKPQIAYRDEVFVILVVNAWELLFKALVSKGGHSIYYKKKRDEPYRTLGWHDALNRAVAKKCWPKGVPHLAVEENVRHLAIYRDSAVHFYNAEGFGMVVFGLSQTSITNYRDILRDAFNEDLSEAITWQLMPLGVEPPVGPMEYLRGTRPKEGKTAVDDFLTSLTRATGRLEKEHVDPGRLLTVFDVKLQSIKKVSTADLTVGLDPDAEPGEATVVHRPLDPRKSHPLLPKPLCEKVGELHGRKFSLQVDLPALVRYFDWRDEQFAHLRYEDPDTNTVRYSNDAVTAIRKVKKSDYQRAREEYLAFRQKRKATKKA